MILWFEDNEYPDINQIVGYGFDKKSRPQFAVVDPVLHYGGRGPDSINPKYLEFADPLHDWCVAIWGPDYYRGIRFAHKKNSGLGIEFDQPQQATLFKLTWVGQ